MNFHSLICLGLLWLIIQQAESRKCKSKSNPKGAYEGSSCQDHGDCCPKVPFCSNKQCGKCLHIDEQGCSATKDCCNDDNGCYGGVCQYCPGMYCSDNSGCCRSAPYCLYNKCSSCLTESSDCSNNSECCTRYCAEGQCSCISGGSDIACQDDSYCCFGSKCVGGLCVSCKPWKEQCTDDSSCCPDVPYCNTYTRNSIPYLLTTPICEEKKDYCRRCAEKTNVYCSSCKNGFSEFNMSVSFDEKCPQICLGKLGKLCACKHFGCHCQDVVDDRVYNDYNVGVTDV